MFSPSTEGWTIITAGLQACIAVILALIGVVFYGVKEEIKTLTNTVARIEATMIDHLEDHSNLKG